MKTRHHNHLVSVNIFNISKCTGEHWYRFNVKKKQRNAAPYRVKPSPTRLRQSVIRISDSQQFICIGSLRSESCHSCS